MSLEIISIQPPERPSVPVERLSPRRLAELEAALWTELGCVLERLTSAEAEPDRPEASPSSLLERIPPARSARKDVLRKLRQWYESTLVSRGKRSPQIDRDRDRAFVLRNLLNDLVWLDQRPGEWPLEVLFVPEPGRRVLAAATYGTGPHSAPPGHPLPYVHNLWSRRSGLGRELLAAIRERTGSERIYLRPLNEGVLHYYRTAFPSSEA